MQTIFEKIITKWKENFPGRALASLFIISTFLSALNKVHDTETWLHLSLGRLIWQMKEVPDTEPFTYPILGEPFSYNSWLFGLLTYALNSHFGAYGLVLLKASVITVAFYILLKDSLRPHKNYAIALVVLSAVLVLSHYRFVIRPDMFLMVFLGFSIFSLNAYLYDNKKYIYSLPVIHLLWTNMHASIIVMFVPFGAFIAGSIIQRYMNNKGIGAEDSLSNTQIKVVALVFAASFMATLITPYFSLHQYLYGPKYISSWWHKEYIYEMLPPKGLEKTLLYIVIAIVSSSFALRGRRISFIYLLLIVPFMVVPIISVRFKFLLAITAGPVLVRNISDFLEYKGWSELFKIKFTATVAASCILLYLVLSIAKVGSFSTRAEFGIGFDYSEVPRGAVEYMDGKGIYGKMLNTFHFGQYITWTGYPERKVFLDARGHLPPELLEKVQLFVNADFILNELYARYGFQSILIELYEQDIPYSHPEWALVYWDDVSLLYLKRGGPYDNIIANDEYIHIKPVASFGHFLENIRNRAGAVRELKRNIRETGSSRGYIFLGLLYNSMGRHKEAIELLSHVDTENRRIKYLSHVITGDAYNSLGDLDSSLYHYSEALTLIDNPGVIYKIARIYQDKGDNRETLKYLKKAIALKEDMLYVYPVLTDTYLALGEKKKAEETRKIYTRLKSAMTVKLHFEKGKNAYKNRNYGEAAEEFRKVIKADPSNPAAYANLGYVYLEMGQEMKAHEYLIKALQINPEEATAKEIERPNAHFGLALIYRKMGNTALAKEHLEEFLKVEPSGHFSRKAKKLMEDM